MVAYKGSSRERAKGGVRFVIAGAKTPLKLALDAFERRERRRDPTRRRFKYYYAGDGTSCCHPWRAMSPTPGSGWSRSGTPRSPRATSASPTFPHLRHGRRRRQRRRRKRKENRAVTLRGKRPPRRPTESTHGPAQKVLPAHLAGYSWSAGRRRRRDDSGGEAAVRTRIGGGSAARPKTPRRQRRLFSAARVRRASPTRTRRRRCSRVSARSELHRVVREHLRFRLPRARAVGVPSDGARERPRAEPVLPRFVLTAEEGLFVYKMNRVLVALGVMDPATGNASRRRPRRCGVCTSTRSTRR